MYNLTSALKSNLEQSILFNFFFLRRTSDDFHVLLNLRVVWSPLILWQSSRCSEPQGTSILFKMLHTVAWRFLILIANGVPTISRHSLLLYRYWACRLLSSVVIRFRRLSFTVLVIITRHYSTKSSLLIKLSTVLDKASKHSQSFSINLSRSFCRFNTNAIRFSFFKSLRVFSVWAICVP